MMDLFDKQIQLRMGQANVKRWVDDIIPLLQDDSDPLGVEDLATHKLPLEQAPTRTRSSRRSRTGPSRSCCSRTARDRTVRANPQVDGR